VVPGHDLVVPAVQPPAEGPDLGWAGRVLAVVGELGDELVGQCGIVEFVDGADDFLSVNRP
jgi:hypothetical protein